MTEYNKNWFKEISEAEISGAKSSDSDGKARIKKEIIAYLNQINIRELPASEFNALVQKVIVFIKSTDSDFSNLQGKLDKLTNSVVSNTKKSLSVAKTEVDREKVDSKDFIYYLTNALVAYAEGLKNGISLNPLAFFNKDSNKIVISSINKTVAELNKLFNNSDNISVKDIISVLSKNLDSEFYRTKILAVYFDSRGNIKRGYREKAIYEVRDNLGSDQLRNIFRKEFSSEIETGIPKITSSAQVEIGKKAEKSLMAYNNAIRKKAVEEFSKDKEGFIEKGINNVEQLEGIMKRHTLEKITGELELNYLTKYLFESDIKIPQEKRWLWLQYVDAFNPKDDWMELSDESIHSVQNFIIFDLVPIIISGGVAGIAGKAAARYGIQAATRVGLATDGVLNTTTKVGKTVKALGVTGNILVQGTTFTASYEGIRNQRWFMNSPNWVKHVILNSLMFGAFKYVDKLGMDKYPGLLRFAENNPKTNGLIRQGLVVPAFLTAITIGADVMTAGELRESQEYLKEFLTIGIISGVLHLIPSGKGKAKIQGENGKNVGEVDLRTGEARMDMGGRDIGAKLNPAELKTTVKEGGAKVEGEISTLNGKIQSLDDKLSVVNDSQISRGMMTEAKSGLLKELETLKLQVESKIKQLEDKLTNMNNSVLANKIFGKDVPRIEKEILELKKVKENIKQLELKENIRNGLGKDDAAGVKTHVEKEASMKGVEFLQSVGNRIKRKYMIVNEGGNYKVLVKVKEGKYELSTVENGGIPKGRLRENYDARIEKEIKGLKELEAKNVVGKGESEKVLIPATPTGVEFTQAFQVGLTKEYKIVKELGEYKVYVKNNEGKFELASVDNLGIPKGRLKDNYDARIEKEIKGLKELEKVDAKKIISNGEHGKPANGVGENNISKDNKRVPYIEAAKQGAGIGFKGSPFIYYNQDEENGPLSFPDLEALIEEEVDKATAFAEFAEKNAAKAAEEAKAAEIATAAATAATAKPAAATAKTATAKPAAAKTATTAKAAKAAEIATAAAKAATAKPAAATATAAAATATAAAATATAAAATATAATTATANVAAAAEKAKNNFNYELLVRYINEYNSNEKGFILPKDSMYFGDNRTNNKNSGFFLRKGREDFIISIDTKGNFKLYNTTGIDYIDLNMNTLKVYNSGSITMTSDYRFDLSNVFVTKK